MTDNLANKNDSRSSSSRPKKKPKLGSSDDFQEDDPIMRKFIKITYLGNILNELNKLKRNQILQYMDDMNNVYSDKETSIVELLDNNNELIINYLLVKIVKVEVGNYLVKFDFNKSASSKRKFLEYVNELILELGNKVHPKINKDIKNNLILTCELFSSPERYYQMVTELYGDEEYMDDETLISLGDFIVPDDELEEEEEEEEEEESADENDTEDFEELKDDLEDKGIFLRGNRIIIKRSRRKKLDDLDKKFMEFTQGKEYNASDLDYFQKLEADEKNKYLKMLGELNKFNGSQKPLMIQVMDFNTSLENKNAIIEKLKQFDNINPFSSEYCKLKKWVDTILRVPFGKYHNYPVTMNDSNKKKKSYLGDLKNTMDDAIYGHDDAKKKILQIVAQSIVNPSGAGNVIAIQGPPGNGKTSLVKEGICKALGRPFAFIPLGGATDACFLEGHDYTYEGSNWGKIVDVLVNSKCMNPVIYFDELDKVSQTAKGEEITNILMHITDATQNSHFNDKYFSGIDFDLSKALFIFSFNYLEKINRVLYDRMFLIRTKGFKMTDKLKISNNYLLPEIMDRCGFSDTNIKFEEDSVRFVIENYTYEGGVRKLKENLLEITREINLRKLNNGKILGKKIKFPLKVTKKMIVDDIFKKKRVYNFTKIHKEPRIGCVNGLYASDNGEGGVTQIETTRVPSEAALSLTLTGSQGKVMKESMSVAKSVAWTLLPSRLKSKLNNEWKKTGNKGIHIHCPEGATPKDGPSAGAAITTALVSLFTGIPVNNKIAMTGEINLNGCVMEIGGLDDKVIGAKKAGAELVLCPKDNKKDLEKIRDSNYNPEDKTFKIVMVDNIWEVLKYALVDSDKCLFNKF